MQNYVVIEFLWTFSYWLLYFADNFQKADNFAWNIYIPMNSLKQRKKKEFWWNVKVKTVTNLKNNRPDLIIWDLHSKECQVVEFSCPGDINVTRKIQEKENTYGPLLRNLQILYSEYSYQFIPIIIGVLGSIPCNLKYNLKCLSFSEKEVKKQIKML